MERFNLIANQAKRKLSKYPIRFQEFQAAFWGPRVLANSIPKAGTNLLLQVLSFMPMLVPRWSCSIDEQAAPLEQEIGRIRRGQYRVGHIYWSNKIACALRSNSVRHIFIIRDLRDIAVSNAFFITYMRPNHRLSPYFNELASDGERLMASIVGVDGTHLAGGIRSKSIGEHATAFMTWLDEPDCLTIRFEDLIGDEGGGNHQRQIQVIQSMALHLGLNIVEKEVARIATHAFNRNSHTFRKGSVGDWRNHFTSVHKSAFKETAGDALIRLGYADGYDW